MARAEGPPAKPGSRSETKILVAPVEVIASLARTTGRNEQASRSRLIESGSYRGVRVAWRCRLSHGVASPPPFPRFLSLVSPPLAIA